MLQPSRQKYRKMQKGRNKGIATTGNKVSFGDFGLKAIGRGRLTARQIEAARRVMTRHIKRGGRVWIRIFPDQDVYKRQHGNSKSHNVPGSIGMAQDPGRVFPGKRMPGHLGATKVTTQNLEVVRVDVERNLLLIKGAIPGSKGGDVVVRPAIKAKLQKGMK